MKSKGKSPASNTLERLRSDGWLPEITERWNVHAGVKQDLFGFGDVLALREGSPALIVQATSRPHIAERANKIISLPAARLWLLSGNLIEVWGWYKSGGRWLVEKRRMVLDGAGQVRAEEPGLFLKALKKRRQR